MSAEKKLFIAFPAYGAPAAATSAALLRLVQSRPIPFDLKSCDNDSALCRARNSLTADFLATECEKMLFLDSDIIFTPEDVARIASHDEDLVGGFYPCKDPAPDVRWCINTLHEGRHWESDDRGLIEVKYVGTGFMCIHRRVFERMMEGNVAAEYKTDHAPFRSEWEFWKMGVHGTRYLTEDWLFCQRWRELGGRVFADAGVMLGHVGTAAWPLPGQNTGMKRIESPINRIAPA